MHNSNGRIWLGIILVIMGGLFFIDSLGFPWFYNFDLRHMIFSWHTIFLIVGIVLIVNHKNSFLGYIFAGIGAFGLLRRLPLFSEYDFGDLWPIILLFTGLWLILRKNGREHVPNQELNQRDQWQPSGEPQQKSTFQHFDTIDEVSVFNTIHRVVSSDNFRGGNVTTIFGGSKLDLTQAKLAPGENILELTTLFGGANIRVPQNWKVILNVTSIFGGFDDKRFAHYKNEESSDGILIIKGVTLFGGGELLY